MSNASSAPRTAILFFTHLFDATAQAAFEHLQRDTSAAGDLFVLTEETGNLPSWVGCVHRFDFSRLRQYYPTVMGENIVPGNCYIPVLDFYKAHSEYDFCWIVEYDVRFSGSWAAFFEEFQNNTTDFLAPYIRRYEDTLPWYWWPSLRAPDGSVAPEKRLCAFMPVYRMSRCALVLMMSRDVHGWQGHCECIVPTILNHHGLSLEDIGGDGDFTPPERRYRFYSSFGFQGMLRHFGSMRWRPPLIFWGGRKNFLYHPVKCETKSWFNFVCYLAGCVRFVIRYLLSRHAFALLRACTRYVRALLSEPGSRR